MSGYNLYEEQRQLNVEARVRRQLIRALDAARHEVSLTRSTEDIEADIARVAEEIEKRQGGKP
jgi:hypothetical protein